MLANKITFTNNAYIDFDEKISVVFPKSDNVKFTNWSNSYFTSLFNKETYEYIKKTNSDAISERYKYAYLGDIEIDYLSDSIVSGLFTIQTTSYDRVVENTFCYDFKKNKKIEIEDALLINEEFKNLIKEKSKAMNYTTEHPLEYTHFSIVESGIKCRTPFNTITGREEMILPYSELKPFILKKGILSKYGNK
jgi:threonyl-tRNA synthetase